MLLAKMLIENETVDNETGPETLKYWAETRLAGKHFSTCSARQLKVIIKHTNWIIADIKKYYSKEE